MLKAGRIDAARLRAASFAPGEWKVIDAPRSVIPNPSGIRPVEFNVLVLPKKQEERTAGGVYIPDVAKERMEAAAIEGEIISVSPLAFSYEDWGNHAMPKVGDRVFFAKYAGMVVKGKDGIEYRLCKDKDIAGVIV